MRRLDVESRASQALNGLSLLCIALLRVLAFSLMLGPVGLVLFLSFSQDTFTIIPPTGYSLRWYYNIVDEPELVEGLITSLKIAFIVSPVTLALGTLAAYGQWRYAVLPGRLLETIVSLPILVPSVVIGLGLLVLFSNLGLYNGFWNIVMAHLILCLPFATRPVILMLSRCDRQLERAAANLGANDWVIFWRVILPQIKPGLLAGAIFAFVASFDDFPIAIFLIDTQTVPLPVAMYHYMEWNIDPTLSAFSALLIAVTTVGAAIINRLVGIGRFFGID